MKTAKDPLTYFSASTLSETNPKLIFGIRLAYYSKVISRFLDLGMAKSLSLESDIINHPMWGHHQGLIV